MSRFTCHPSRKRWLFLLSATTCLTSGSAVAQVQITKYVAINPIVVCKSDGSGCAPFNTSSATGRPSAANPTINFVNSAGTDITGAILNQIGVGLAYAAKPDGTILIQQYNSPPNAPPAGTPNYATTDFRELHVFKVADPNPNAPPGSTIFQSYDFLELSGYQPPTPPLNPAVPLAQNRLIINEFFVNKIYPDSSQAGSTIYEWALPNANGFAVAAPTFFPPFPLTPRTGVPAHGLGHNLDTYHDTFGAGPDATGACSKTAFTGCAPNVMTSGSLRTEPTVACVLMSPPSTSCASMSLPNGTADQLTLISEERPPTFTTSQQRHMLLSNFLMNSVPSSTISASKPPTTTAAVAVAGPTSTALTTSSAGSSSKSDDSIIFNLVGPKPGTDIPGDSIDLAVITIEKGAQLDPQNPPASIFVPQGIAVSFNVVAGNQGNGPALCSDPASDCVLASFSPGLPESPQHATFSVGIRKPPGPVDLCSVSDTGLFVTYKFHISGLTVTSRLTGTPPNCSNRLTADSQNPITETLSFDPSAYVPPSGPSGSLLPCTPVAGDSGDFFFCPDPRLTGGLDGDANDNAQPPGPTGGSAPR